MISSNEILGQEENRITDHLNLVADENVRSVLRDAFNFKDLQLRKCKEQIHRRNLQITDLKRQVASPLSWTTISDLFFNSSEVEDIDWESCGQVGSDDFKKVVASAVDEWCSMYPEIGNSIDQENLVKDYLNRI